MYSIFTVTKSLEYGRKHILFGSNRRMNGSLEDWSAALLDEKQEATWVGRLSKRTADNCNRLRDVRGQPADHLRCGGLTIWSADDPGVAAITGKVCRRFTSSAQCLGMAADQPSIPLRCPSLDSSADDLCDADGSCISIHRRRQRASPRDQTYQCHARGQITLHLWRT